MSQAPSQKPPTSALAVVGLVLTFLCLQPFAFIVSLIALIRINKSQGRLGGQALAIVALCLTVPMCGVQAAIAIPNFVKFQCRSKQSEAKSNLKVLAISEESYKGEHAGYTADTGALGFAPHAKFYTYKIVGATPTTFQAEAVGVGTMAEDHWVVDQSGQPKNTGGNCQ